jgi:hypothetical protein
MTHAISLDEKDLRVDARTSTGGTSTGVVAPKFAYEPSTSTGRRSR